MKERHSIQKLPAKDVLSAYKRINFGYRKKATYHMRQYGFGSNINCAITGMLYCLVYKWQFQLKLTTDFRLPDEKHSLPFCIEQYSPPEKSGLISGHVPQWRELHPFTLRFVFATYQYGYKSCISRLSQIPGCNNFLKYPVAALWCRWAKAEHKKFLRRHFVFPQLGIDGNFFHAGSVIARMIFQLTAKAAGEHRAAMENLKPYIAVHVRKGDKITSGEMKKIEEQKYLEKAQSLAPGIRNIFVATDDYQVVRNFKKWRPDLNIITLCNKQKKGYDHQKFLDSLHKEKEEEWLEFLVDLYYLESADYFVGTYSSNIGRIVALLKGLETCHSLDRGWYSK